MAARVFSVEKTAEHEVGASFAANDESAVRAHFSVCGSSVECIGAAWAQTRMVLLRPGSAVSSVKSRSTEAPQRPEVPWYCLATGLLQPPNGEKSAAGMLSRISNQARAPTNRCTKDRCPSLRTRAAGLTIPSSLRLWETTESWRCTRPSGRRPSQIQQRTSRE